MVDKVAQPCGKKYHVAQRPIRMKEDWVTEQSREGRDSHRDQSLGP